LKLIEQAIGKKAEDVGNAVCLLLVLFAAVLLEFGMGREIIEAGQLGFLGVRAERLAVDGDEAGDGAILGFDDELGGV
jgi:hypothetical protein